MVAEKPPNLLLGSLTESYDKNPGIPDGQVFVSRNRYRFIFRQMKEQMDPHLVRLDAAEPLKVGQWGWFKISTSPAAPSAAP